MDRLEFLKKQLFDGFFIKKEWWGDDLSILEQEGVEKKTDNYKKSAGIQRSL